MGRRLRLARRPALSLVGAVAVLVGALAAPAAALAHPLGNFTINHFAGLTIATDRLDLDVVIDMAEIPAFQERQRIDTDGDGEVSDEDLGAEADRRCEALAGELRLTAAGAPVPLERTAAGLTFPAGTGGLATLRLECGYRGMLATPIAGPTTIALADESDPARIGWREIVVAGSGVVVDPGEAATTSISARLTAYPDDLLAAPLDVRAVEVVARPGDGTGPDPSPGSGPAAPAPGGGAVPGGIGAELPSIFRTADLTPILALAALATAVALGAGHALTPGHGKTLMAAYLVGTRGTAVHAVGLGLAVTVSHTLGILVLAGLVVGAEGLLPPDVVVRAAPVVAALAILGIGAWMVVGEVRRRVRRAGSVVSAAAHDHEPHHEHGHDAPHHEHDHDHHAGPGHDHAPDHGHHGHDVDAGSDQDDPAVHRHGGVRHRHLPPAGGTVTWRSLFVLGLAGGLIPSTSALLILLGSIAAGRAAFGVVLVVAFGLGMAVVMSGVGLVMVAARSRLDRLPRATGLGRLASQAPLVASVLVLGLGVWLTIQAVAGGAVL